MLWSQLSKRYCLKGLLPSLFAMSDAEEALNPAPNSSGKSVRIAGCQIHVSDWPDQLSLSQKQSVQPARTPFHFHFNFQPHFDLPLCLEGEKPRCKWPETTAQYSFPSLNQTKSHERRKRIDPSTTSNDSPFPPSDFPSPH